MLPTITWGSDRKPQPRVDLLDPYVLPQAQTSTASPASRPQSPPIMADLPPLSWSTLAENESKMPSDQLTPPLSTEKKKRHFSFSPRKQVRFQSPPPSPPDRGSFSPPKTIKKKPPPPPPPSNQTLATANSDLTLWPKAQDPIAPEANTSTEPIQGFEYTPRVYKSVWKEEPDPAAVLAAEQARQQAERQAIKDKAQKQQTGYDVKLKKTQKSSTLNGASEARPVAPAAAAQSPWTYVSPFGTPSSQIESIARGLTGGQASESSDATSPATGGPDVNTGGQSGWRHPTWDSTPVRGPYYGMSEIPSKALVYAVSDCRYRAAMKTSYEYLVACLQSAARQARRAATNSDCPIIAPRCPSLPLRTVPRLGRVVKEATSRASFCGFGDSELLVALSNAGFVATTRAVCLC